jgi:hypothetical protein
MMKPLKFLFCLLILLKIVHKHAKGVRAHMQSIHRPQGQYEAVSAEVLTGTRSIVNKGQDPYAEHAKGVRAHMQSIHRP